MCQHRRKEKGASGSLFRGSALGRGLRGGGAGRLGGPVAAPPRSKTWLGIIYIARPVPVSANRGFPRQTMVGAPLTLLAPVRNPDTPASPNTVTGALGLASARASGCGRLRSVIWWWGVGAETHPSRLFRMRDGWVSYATGRASFGPPVPPRLLGPVAALCSELRNGALPKMPIACQEPTVDTGNVRCLPASKWRARQDSNLQLQA